MNTHNNARLTPRGREILISRLHRAEHPAGVATAMGVSPCTVYKWRRRYGEEGQPDLNRTWGLKGNSAAGRHGAFLQHIVFFKHLNTVICL